MHPRGATFGRWRTAPVPRIPRPSAKPPDERHRDDEDRPHIDSSADPVDTLGPMLWREYSRQISGRFRKQTKQATIERDLGVYPAFAKLRDVSSRNFTAWRPDDIGMKIGATIEVTSIGRVDLCLPLATLARRVARS